MSASAASGTIPGMWSFFNGGKASAFGAELAAFILSELGGKLNARDAKFKTKAEKTLANAARRVQQFKKTQGLNFYTKSRMANSFLWALKGGGCPEAYADELTEWLTLRL